MKTKDGKFEIYYLFRCDAKNKPSGVIPDKGFCILEKEKKDNYKQLLDRHNLNYDMLIEEFCWDGEEIINQHNIILNNYKNN